MVQSGNSKEVGDETERLRGENDHEEVRFLSFSGISMRRKTGIEYFMSKFRRERLRELEYNLRWYEAENRRIVDLFRFPEIEPRFTDM